MSNSQPDDQIEKGADPRSVEDNWQELLINYGEDVDVETAERIIRSLQSHPTLALGDPSIDETQELIENAIKQVDLTEYGISDSDTVKHLLREELREGLAGNRIGPMALTTPAKKQIPTLSGPGDGSETGQHPASPNTGAPSETMTNDNTDNSSDSQESQPAGDTESISVDPSEIDATGDAAAPAATGAVPDAAAQDESTDSPDTPDSPQTIDIDEDLDVFIANQVVAQMKNEHLSEDAPDELIQLIGRAAELGAYQQQQFIKRYLVGHLDENARDLIFEQTILEPVKDQVAEDLQRMNE